MYAERHTVVVVTDGEEAATEFSEAITGRVHSIAYIKDDFAEGVDFAITAEATGESLWTESDVDASATVYPLAAGNLGATGAASTLTEVPIVLAGDRIKIAIADGGEVKTGTFIITVGG